jgi:hypothetical protein
MIESLSRKRFANAANDPHSQRSLRWNNESRALRFRPWNTACHIDHRFETMRRALGTRHALKR